MVYNLNGNFDSDLVNDFIEFLNDHDNTKDLTIYLHSGGGYCWVGEQLKSIIEGYEGKVTLIASYSICSSAFDLFFSAKVNKKILPGTMGMCHQMSWGVDTNTSLKPSDDYEQFKMYYLKEDTSLEDLNKVVKFHKIELKKMKEGKDLWVNTKRLNQMLRYNKKALTD